MSENQTKFRQEMPFPAEHMRLVGEICVQWMHIELLVLQALCESANIGHREGFYLGNNIGFQTQIDMLQAAAATLKEAKEREGAPEKGTMLSRNLESLRSAYRIRCKYAHALLTLNGSGDPTRHIMNFKKRVELEDEPLTTQQMRDDSDIIWETGNTFLSFMQASGLCKAPWL